MITYSELIKIVLTAIATGFGAAIGGYFATNHALSKLKSTGKLVNKIKKKFS